MSKTEYSCFWCGKPIQRYPSQAKGRRVYCSAPCSSMGRREASPLAPRVLGTPMYTPAVESDRRFLDSGSVAG